MREKRANPSNILAMSNHRQSCTKDAPLHGRSISADRGISHDDVTRDPRRRGSRRAKKLELLRRQRMRRRRPHQPKQILAQHRAMRGEQPMRRAVIRPKNTARQQIGRAPSVRGKRRDVILRSMNHQRRKIDRRRHVTREIRFGECAHQRQAGPRIDRYTRSGPRGCACRHRRTLPRLHPRGFPCS